MMTGPIHHPWRPPRTTKPAKKNPTIKGALSRSGDCQRGVATPNAKNNRKPPTMRSVWWPDNITTVQAISAMCTAVTQSGTVGSAGASVEETGGRMASNSRRNQRK